MVFQRLLRKYYLSLLFLIGSFYIYLVHLNFCTVEEVRKVEDINLIKLLSNLSSVRGQKFSLERSS